jgi:hypothetical protein
VDSSSSGQSTVLDSFEHGYIKAGNFLTSRAMRLVPVLAALNLLNMELSEASY